MRSLLRVSLVAAAAATVCAAAQTPPAPDPCAAPQSHEFDFWVGDWDVFVPDGKLVGTNRIAPIYGCVLHEYWKTPKMEGQSFNRFDPDRGVWHQTWVDSTGGILMIEGGIKDGAMVLSDRTLAGRKDPAVVNEITWIKLADGAVRQHWRMSKDGGKTWSTTFDGRYVRSSRPQPKWP
jgi:hypothetical protein